MCDTVGFPRRYFGKNSDREPGEVQLFQYVTVDDVTPADIRAAGVKPGYIGNELPVLEQVLKEEGLVVSNTCGALVSRPEWLWGAEIGVNDHGVAIGNEGVFSRRGETEGVLLGMDILRLALHRSKSADEAVSVILDLVRRYGQGGDGGFRHPLHYSNSYTVQDAEELWVIETSRREVRVRRSETPAGISNTYCADGGWEEERSNGGAFKRRDEKRIFAIAGRGMYRNRLKEPWLNGSMPLDTALEIFSILRRHGSVGEEGEYDRPRKGMGSICIHTGSLIKSETTASMVVDWTGDATGGERRVPVVWYTGSSWPCVSLYKPLLVGSGNGEIEFLRSPDTAASLYRDRLVFNRYHERRHESFHRNVAPYRDELEVSFLREVTELEASPSAEEYVRFVERVNATEREYMANYAGT